jgi:hypothetical protein
VCGCGRQGRAGSAETRFLAGTGYTIAEVAARPCYGGLAQEQNPYGFRSEK